MSAPEKPVWVWLPGLPDPVRCGSFTLENRVGRFAYDAAYRARPDALALDPIALPFTRSTRPWSEVRQGGLFGVFRDASPEGFGLAVLEQLRGQNLVEPLQRLEFSVGDAAGAIEVCDDIEPKRSYRAPDSAELLDVLAGLPEERPSSQAARQVQGIQGTSLGGERPKLTVRHRHQLWIAKLQDRGDAPHVPLREFVAMRLARRCGIDAAEVELQRVGNREILFVRRFDRELDDAGRILRHLYASAHTVLRLDAQTRGDRLRSYVALAHQLQRWCASKQRNGLDLQRELWRRMAFNAIIGNGDDHPRNHGLVYRGGGWTLSPAFDIAPYPVFSKTLAMAITRDGSSIASTANLLRNCDNFGYETAEARAFIERAKDVVAREFEVEIEAAGFERGALGSWNCEWLGE